MKSSSEKTVRITVEALKYYVPLYQMGAKAEEQLIEFGEELTAAERNHLETVTKLKELSVRKIADLSGPLITQELNKIIASSHLRGQESLFDLLYYAGMNGMRLGLKKFDVEKINVSSTNYLFQWITTYARKELNVIEAPFGIPPSRFQKYKKIAAVRKKLSEKYNRAVSNEEIFSYFSSGAADIVNMNGRIADRGKPSKANLSITLDLIIEQEKFETQMFSMSLLDPIDGYTEDVQMIDNDSPIFSETIFGVFCAEYNVSPIARTVIMSELNIKDIKDEEVLILQSLSKKEYSKYATQWKNLVKDINGPFYEFLKKNSEEEFTQFDVKSVLKSIEQEKKIINPSAYAVLFDSRKENII